MIFMHSSQLQSLCLLHLATSDEHVLQSALLARAMLGLALLNDAVGHLDEVTISRAGSQEPDSWRLGVAVGVASVK